MMNKFQIPQMQPYINQIDKDKLIEYINSDSWYTEHELTKEFEAKISEFVKIKHAIAVNNGTISLERFLFAVSVR